jgi:hypothetical protein
MPIQAITGFFGAQEQNRAAQEQADAINKRNRVARRFTNKNQRQQFRYDKDSIDIQRKNIAQEYAFQDAIAQDNYRYQMTIQAFDFANQMRAFQQSQQTAAQQLDFNRFAQDYAIQDAARWEQEQSISLDFEEKSTMMNFRYNQLGAELSQKQNEAVLQQTRGQGQLNQQSAYVEALKNMGQAVARGANGVTAEKVAQSSIAEAGLRMSALIDDVFNAERTFGLSMADINQKLTQFNDQYYLDRAQIATSRTSLKNQTQAMVQQAALSKYQADLNAMANIMLPPLPPVPLPTPRALPRPTLQDPKKPKPLPKVVEVDAAYTNPWLAGLSGLAEDVKTAVSIAAL